MKTTIYLIASALATYALMLVLVPVIKKIAIQLGLTDRPNNRKLHTASVPVVGGIAITLASSLVSMISISNDAPVPGYFTVLAASLFLLIVGVLDDKYDLRASHKLLFQMFCAFAVAGSGTRLTSLYGFLGVYDLPMLAQYGLTVILICGVINAFNLIDGIDGLIGALGLIGFFMLMVFSCATGNISLAILFAALVGALVGFLKFNLGREKIFMGDAGSLLIGNLLICSGLYLLQHIGKSELNSALLYCMIGFFALPVLDSMRVYLGRMKKGMSPFTADKSHLHHLLLLLGLSHRQITVIIAAITISILVATLCLQRAQSLTLSIVLILVVFSILGFVLNMNKKVNEWIISLKEMES